SAYGASITTDAPTPPPDPPQPTSSAFDSDPFSGDLTLDTDKESFIESGTKLEPTSVRVLPTDTEKSSVKPTKPRRKFTGSLKRIKSLSQLLRDSFASHTVDASSIETIRSKKRRTRKRDFDSESLSSGPATPPVPQLPLNPTHPSSLSLAADDAESDRSSPTASISSLPEETTPPPLPVPPPSKKHSAPASFGHIASSVTHYEFVNPSELTASPSPLAGSSLVNSSARSSFLPPSPSWLSRNVHNLDPTDTSINFPPSRISALSDSDHLRVPEIGTYYTSALFAPDSPRPLHVPVPVLPVPPPQSRQFAASPCRPTLQRLVTDIYPASPVSDADSFVTSPTPPESTLYSPISSITPTTAFASANPSPSPQFHRRLSNISQISVERHRHSISRLKRSRTASPRPRRQQSLRETKSSVNPLFKDLSSRNQLSNGPKFPLVKAPPSPVTCDNSSDDRTIFIPPHKPAESALTKQSPLPKDLALLLEAFFIQSGIFNSFAQPNMDFTGKNIEAVDFGGEVDYSGHQ
ncbi:hypothetical protein HYDPIDRAFT_27753, partial [Hydnomerulius pinastri MD-312]